MKKLNLIAGVLLAISPLAVIVSPAFADTASSPLANAELIRNGMGKGNTFHPNDGFIGRKKVGTKWLKPRTCYRRKRVGPKKYVTVRRPC